MIEKHIVYPVFEPHNWSSITYILCFHQTSSTPLLPLQSLPSSPISFPIPLKLFSPSKSTTTHHALKSLTSIIPSPRPFSGRAILLDGIPKKLSHHHVNNSLLRLGYPIITPPSQSSWSISTSHSDQPLLTRYQIVYVNSVALAHHMAGQLHRSRPAWLPSSTSQHLQSQHASSTANEDGDGTGWELKARVLY